jgi:hypothetical protein
MNKETDKKLYIIDFRIGEGREIEVLGRSDFCSDKPVHEWDTHRVFSYIKNEGIDLIISKLVQLKDD